MEFRLQPKRKHSVIVGLIVSILVQFLPLTAQASGFQIALLRMDRTAASTASSGTACVKPATTATEASVKLTFPTGFTVGSAASFTVSTTNMPVINSTTATPWPGITTASNVTGQIVTFGSSDLTVGTLYCFNFAAGVTNGTAGNNLQAKIETYATGPTLIDSTPVALSVISNDQVSVTAVVPPSFTFTISSNTDAFTANLDPTVVKNTTGVNIYAATNAKGGWIAWVKDSAQGLFSPTASYTIPTVSATGAASTLTAGTEKYGMVSAITTDAAGGCTVATTAPYNGTPGTTAGGFAATFTQLANCTGGSPGTSNGDTITMTEYATIANSTPAASDYADIITVVGTGLF